MSYFFGQASAVHFFELKNTDIGCSGRFLFCNPLNLLRLVVFSRPKHFAGKGENLFVNFHMLKLHIQWLIVNT